MVVIDGKVGGVVEVYFDEVFVEVICVVVLVVGVVFKEVGVEVEGGVEEVGEGFFYGWVFGVEEVFFCFLG